MRSPHPLRRKRRLGALTAALLGCLLLVFQAGGPAGASQEAPDDPAPTAAFSNPIVAENGADPWIVQHEGRYYHLGTTWASHWEMRVADTLGGLGNAEPVTVYTENDPSRCCNFWAPELHRLQGPDGPRWYLTYSAGVAENIDHQHVHVLESAGDDPLGPYTHRGQIDPHGDNRWMIDSSYLTMPDGRLYLLYSFWEGGTQNLYVAPLTNPWTPAAPGVRISTPTHAWEQQGGSVNEGPVILRHDGRTFLVYSASHCDTPDYKLGMLELVGDPMDPAGWVKHPEPILQRDDAAGVYGPGHNGFFTSPDGSETWIVYHANSSPSDGCSGTRTSRAQPVRWNADGTPNLGTPVAEGVELPGPAGE
ncbi:glycoside hydrolase family 43 protein [Streptomyces triticirhizae]|uniref:Alpha-N-arabinofuranosidase n=1 Tax=Streptomyces triticirhizae TaxID=2483353 RepID=A0A3M2M815_9ACTN|nr:glycoside hydrolase family 43 protein [Streptomyces triticirhizae]RMI43258.1 alpha-N-arabinofuranosidase [Streptomyces triticirhizae]RMI44785.1 alpha-N-arabinofuranosidase [Streptomyces triticirhizae]